MITTIFQTIVPFSGLHIHLNFQEVSIMYKKILISPHSVHFRQKALKVILLYYLQILEGAFIFL